MNLVAIIHLLCNSGNELFPSILEDYVMTIKPSPVTNIPLKFEKDRGS